MTGLGSRIGVGLATFAAGALVSAGCGALKERSSLEPVQAAPSKPRLAPRGIAQLAVGAGAPFALCTAETCPKPTPKTAPSSIGEHTQGIADASVKTQLEVQPGAPSREPEHKRVTIAFAAGAASLTAQARRVLDALLPEAQQATEIEIRGRTDGSGSPHLNDILALQRAMAVREYLRTRKLPPHTLIRVSAKGACCYVAPNETDEGRAANRRVEIEIKRPIHLAQGRDPHGRF